MTGNRAHRRRTEIPTGDTQSDPEVDSGSNAWMITYVDMLTLLITLFVVLLAKANFSPQGEPYEGTTDQREGTPLRVKRLIGPALLDHGTLAARTRQVARFVRHNQLESSLFVAEEGGTVIVGLSTDLLQRSKPMRLSAAGHAALESLTVLLKGVSGRITVTGVSTRDEGSTASSRRGYTDAMTKAVFIAELLVRQGVDARRIRMITEYDPRAGKDLPLRERVFAEVRILPELAAGSE